MFNWISKFAGLAALTLLAGLVVPQIVSATCTGGVYDPTNRTNPQLNVSLVVINTPADPQGFQVGETVSFQVTSFAFPGNSFTEAATDLRYLIRFDSPNIVYTPGSLRPAAGGALPYFSPLATVSEDTAGPYFSGNPFIGDIPTITPPDPGAQVRIRADRTNAAVIAKSAFIYFEFDAEVVSTGSGPINPPIYTDNLPVYVVLHGVAVTDRNCGDASVPPQYPAPTANRPLRDTADITELVPVLSVDLLSFDATASESGVALEWETAGEVDNVGFNVYRVEYVGNESVLTKLNSALIPAGNPEGDVYSLTDSLPVGSDEVRSYVLEDVDSSGKATIHGPIHLGVNRSSTSVSDWNLF